MAKSDRIVRASADEIRAMRRQGKTHSDWAEAEQLADEEDGALPEGWESTVEIWVPEPAQPVNIRIDASVLRSFKARGLGYQTRINEVPRAFVRAGERAEVRRGR